jgi:uncharacterized protein (DUF885 family)
MVTVNRLISLATCLLLPVAAPVLHAQEDAHSQLHALFDEAWEFDLREYPVFATSVGDQRYNDRLGSVAPSDHARRAEANRAFLVQLRAIDRSALDVTDRVSYDMFERRLRDDLAGFEFRTYEMPITADAGFHVAFARLPRFVPLFTVDDYENYIERLKAYPAYVQQHIENMRAGLARGFSMPRIVLEGYEVTIASHVVDDPTESTFYAPFAAFPISVPAGEHARLEAAGRAAIAEAVVPGYRAFLEFMTGEYMPNTRTTIGASETPNGMDYYAFLVRYFTTLDLTPEEVHQIGLREVDRIRVDMEAIVEEVEFAGSFADFLEFLRTDPRFYADSPEELLREASFIAKRMDGKLPTLFKTLPRLPYGVAPVPDHLAPKYTGGRYVPPAEGSTEPGYYWVNTYNLPARPLYTLPALTLHEAVPGHHLQGALTRELVGLPDFRRHSYINAFGEGWGLYSEWLGIEADIYTDPYSNFGRLTYEMWRACRLVVDTGIHAFGWTRDQAMEYLASNTALSLHEVRTETDRYISWPGQALAYKIGELTIRELRGRAEEVLGERFDVREFHDVILGQGTVPLSVLEDQVDEYIAAVLGRETK